MPAYSMNEVVLIRYPFSDLPGSKVRPAIVISAPHSSQDLFLVPLTSRTLSLLEGEFVLADRAAAALNVPSAVKRGLYTVHSSLVVKSVGRLGKSDAEQLRASLRSRLEL